jgi:Fic family protein
MKVASPPQVQPILATLLSERADAAFAALASTANDPWLHWDVFRRHTPPEGLTIEQWWALTAVRRTSLLRELPLRSGQDARARLAEPPSVRRRLHGLDLRLASQFGLKSQPTSRDPEELISDALVEEALRSSQIEGAVSTRRDAERMIWTRARPRGRSEQMILNNYHAMERIRVWVRERREVSVAALLELQSVLVDGTHDADDVSGRLRTEADGVVLSSDATQEIVFVPPPAIEIASLLAELVTFANAAPAAEPFVHPLTRAVVCHYQLAWIHPFVDGNGRSARALWYWVALRNNDPAVEFISLSQQIAKARQAYYRSFLHVESDNADLTYFVASQLEFLDRAVEQVERELSRRDAVRAALPAAIRRLDIDERQRRVIEQALRFPERETTIAAHQAHFGVAYATARADLLGLVELGLLQQRTEGRKLVFWPIADLERRLRAMDA